LQLNFKGNYFQLEFDGKLVGECLRQGAARTDGRTTRKHRAAAVIEMSGEGIKIQTATKQTIVYNEFPSLFIKFATYLPPTTFIYLLLVKIELLLKILCMFWFLVSFYIMYAYTYG